MTTYTEQCKNAPMWTVVTQCLDTTEKNDPTPPEIKALWPNPPYGQTIDLRPILEHKCEFVKLSTGIWRCKVCKDFDFRPDEWEEYRKSSRYPVTKQPYYYLRFLKEWHQTEPKDFKTWLKDFEERHQTHESTHTTQQ